MNHDNKQLLFLSIVSLVSQTMISMINLSLVYYLKDVFSYSPSLIGISTSSFSISYVVFCLINDKPTSHFSPRHIITVALLGMGFSILLFLNSNHFLTILISLVAYGAFMSLLWPIMGTWFSRGREKEQLNRAISFFNLSWGFGMSISPIICGILTEVNVSLPIIIGIICFFILAINVLIFTSKVPYLKVVESEKQYIKYHLQKDNSTPLRYLAWAAIFLGYFFMGLLLNIFPLYAREELLINETKIGWLLWSRGITSCVAFYFLGKASFWQFKKSLIMLSQFVLALLCLSAVYFTRYYSWFILFTLFGFVFSLIYMQSIFHGMSGSINRARRMMIHEVLLTAGIVFGSILGGHIYESLDFKTVMIDFSKFMFAVIFLEFIFSYIYKKSKLNKIKMVGNFM